MRTEQPSSGNLLDDLWAFAARRVAELVLSVWLRCRLQRGRGNQFPSP